MTAARVVEAVALPLAVTALSAMSKRIEREHGPGCVMAQSGRFLLIATAGDGDPLGCGCLACDSERRTVIRRADGATWADGLLSHMIVCPDCGNKRCPRAAHHDRACTGSNEPGQPGSAYPEISARDRAKILAAFGVTAEIVGPDPTTEEIEKP